MPPVDFSNVNISLPPPNANGKFGEAMLQANHLFGGTDGAVLCQNPETFAYALFRPFPLPPHGCGDILRACRQTG